MRFEAALFDSLYSLSVPRYRSHSFKNHETTRTTRTTTTTKELSAVGLERRQVDLPAGLGRLGGRGRPRTEGSVGVQRIDGSAARRFVGREDPGFPRGGRVCCRRRCRPHVPRTGEVPPAPRAPRASRVRKRPSSRLRAPEGPASSLATPAKPTEPTMQKAAGDGRPQIHCDLVVHRDGRSRAQRPRSRSRSRSRHRSRAGRRRGERAAGRFPLPEEGPQSHARAAHRTLQRRLGRLDVAGVTHS